MNILELHHVRKHFGSFVATNDVSFSVGKGRIFGLVSVMLPWAACLVMVCRPLPDACGWSRCKATRAIVTKIGDRVGAGATVVIDPFSRDATTFARCFLEETQTGATVFPEKVVIVTDAREKTAFYRLVLP